MPDTKQLPHLLKLLDDDSPRVQRSITEALKAFGVNLEIELARLPEPPDAEQMVAIYALIGHPHETTPARFKPGQLVKHKHYGYRGVIVASDPTCQGTDTWYYSNASQPDRDQPWYHVLIHDAEHTTYAAQSSLDADNSGEAIKHPWLNDFFSEFVQGHYVRNNRPWMT